MSKDKVRTRFAPSPTGYLHIGGVRTALFAYLFAKKNQGDFILRVEDTDQARFVEGAIEKLVESLHASGIFYDEGVFFENGKLVNKGEYGPYLQSERKEIYKEYAEKLVKDKYAYYCFCTEERLDQLRKEQVALKKPTLYDRRCKNLSAEEVQEKLAAGETSVIRQAIPEDGVTVLKDLVYGEIKFENKLLDDQVLLKTDGFPTYHLAVVVDDHLMRVSHVIRGDEWIPSTPKHILLYKAFGWEETLFAHLPLILNKDKTKLSKRQGDVAVEDYLAKGYLKDALINFIALLGWSPKTDQEIFSLDELIEGFDFNKVNKSGAVFDIDKLDWVNNYYIKQLPLNDLINRLKTYLEKVGIDLSKYPAEFIEAIISIEKERLKKLSEIGDRVQYFFQKPEYEPRLLIWKKANLEKTREAIHTMIDFIKNLKDSEFEPAALEDKTKAMISLREFDNGTVLWPTRVALSGLEKSPGPFELIHILHKGYGVGEIISRLEIALKKLE